MQSGDPFFELPPIVSEKNGLIRISWQAFGLDEITQTTVSRYILTPHAAYRLERGLAVARLRGLLSAQVLTMKG